MGRLYLRILNALVWIGVWLGAAYWSGAWGNFIPMFVEAFVPAMLGGFIHIALRKQHPTS